MRSNSPDHSRRFFNRPILHHAAILGAASLLGNPLVAHASIKNFCKPIAPQSDMHTWPIFQAGHYEIICNPLEDVYHIGSPIFRTATIQKTGLTSFFVEPSRPTEIYCAGDATPFVESVTTMTCMELTRTNRLGQKAIAYSAVRRDTIYRGEDGWKNGPYQIADGSFGPRKRCNPIPANRIRYTGRSGEYRIFRFTGSNPPKYTNTWISRSRVVWC